ncbi:replication restart helicase PriA [Leptospirillum ferriphilum]|jgi:primosomal protein N' (replication factor Y)|uniref:Replication restart protein PriA n=3 Tax=Leptospirillum ferriphilum TaxID=178606 RepID=A0A059Y345_9BACT|nr:primosomal protein N' [Leptospirillum ferriphilum]MCL5259551.1 primosomal protein N' [Nitrospirota bacterium]AFS54528.1 primosomal protein N [Leptospirillum ferriphilum ML-04]AIA32016.1 hypothetical protein Y981_12150 [Leptospirillum ferriphilum YSK]OOH71489.1 primosomal protein N' [Leptospirillum ferriphilum]OOH77821.1 primosomal protein N' [Leptospirillum ferriphilum]
MKSVTIVPMTGLPEPFLTYSWTETDRTPIPGTRVRIPLGKREIVGFIWNATPPSPQKKLTLKPVLEILDSYPVLPPCLHPIYEFSSWFYRLPLGLLLRNTLPQPLAKPLPLSSKIQQAAPSPPSRATSDLPPMTDDQKQVFLEWEAKQADQFSITVLRGVTGSGKTRLYQEMAKHTFSRDRQVLLLTPEIGLVPQLEEAFSGLVPRIGVIHSQITPMKRLSSWMSILRGEMSLVVGPRSAFFSPLTHLGLIIVDEEHDSAYQAWEGLSFNVRNLALKYAQLRQIPVVLGSATPLAESLYYAGSHRYTLLSLPRRIHGSSLPEITLTAPSRKEKIFPSSLLGEIDQTLKDGEQTVILLNRRGYAPLLQCLTCKNVLMCKKCSVRLVLHKKPTRQLVCHLCASRFNPPDHCSECGGTFLSEDGLATQKAEDLLSFHFPNARVIRLDQDTRSREHSSRTPFSETEADILIGTQMIAKGHDFRRVTLGIVLEMDQALSLPDYRSEERVFQLVLQLAGRVGRHRPGGRVHLVTAKPDLPLYQYLKNYDQDGFIQHVLRERKAFGYPPFGRIALLTLSSKDEKTLLEIVSSLDRLWRAGHDTEGVSLLGPVPAPVYKAKLYYRYQYLIKSSSIEKIHSAIDFFQKQLAPVRGAHVGWAVDPPDLLSF